MQKWMISLTIAVWVIGIAAIAALGYHSVRHRQKNATMLVVQEAITRMQRECQQRGGMPHIVVSSSAPVITVECVFHEKTSDKNR